MEVQGKSAVVTGGGNGIGRAIALALAEAGANVAIADLEEAAAGEVASEVSGFGVRSLARGVDVTDPAQVEALADAAWEAFGSVELLVNNAGVLPQPKPLVSVTPDDFRWAFDVNVGGVLNGIRAFAPRFIESGAPARIVNTGSEHSLGIPHVGAGIYTATKHALLGISDVLRRELPDQVGVSILCPGMVASSLWRSEARRPDARGGKSDVDETIGGAMQRFAMPAEEVAARFLEGVRKDRFLILTHAHVVGYAESRWEEISREFAEQAPRYDGDDAYDVNNIMARALGGGGDPD